MENCVCGSGKNKVNCCEIFITHQKTPTTPEELMRSRYTAYTQANMEYIAATMKAPANIDFDMDHTRAWAREVTWLRLDVVNTSEQDDKGFVEFMAHYLQHNKHHVIHELSEFQRENNQWFYVNGKPPEKKLQATINKVSRNDFCPCGSTKKYKKCCGNPA